MTLKFDKSVLKTRWFKRAVASCVALAVLWGGWIGFRAQYPPAVLGKICNGMLPVDPMLDLIGRRRIELVGVEFESSSSGFYGSSDVVEPEGLSTQCRADGVEISIETSAGARNAHNAYTGWDDPNIIPTALKPEWNGLLLDNGRDNLASSVLVGCKNWTSRQGGGILVTVDVDEPGVVSAPQKLARVAVGAARRAAERTGCDAEFGDSNAVLGADDDSEVVSAGEATGVCAGMHSAPFVLEVPAAVSPVESCVLGGKLKFVAQYGPFVPKEDSEDPNDFSLKDSGSYRSYVWTTAKCGGALGRALYKAIPTAKSERSFDKKPLTQAEREDLQHFAAQSAKRHHCGVPTALGGTSK
ncbi:hypothetical protein [Streptomyces sp. NBC_01465]|uniref:hypothetical protein n=1 Tax=Streptomyces sp. NBC_01465 TaxID=2903878 RepID=UPI002E316D7E|nr:hypothetical protein [Streptomyces sp. NBC_01465]